MNKFVKEKLDEFVNYLDSIETSNNNYALNGNGGLALFYFHFYQYSQNDIYYDKAIRLLEQAVDHINEVEPNPSFYDGISGVGWLVEHLSENDFIEIDTDSFFEEIVDDYLHNDMIQLLNSGHFGFYDGSLGNCLYFAKRYKNTNSQESRKKYRNYIIEVIFFMENLRLHGLSGIIIPKKNHSNLPDSDINNYLANMINLLTLLYTLNDFNPIIMPLLEDLSSFILKHENLQTYIKPVVALSLWKTGKILNKKDAVERSEEIFQKGVFENELDDIEGYFRTSLVYDFLFRETNHPVYNEFKEYWMNKGLKCISAKGVENFSEGLWNGLPGVGLSLISLENNFKTNWQECLLIGNNVK